jgi:ribose 5-phosphate isomerase B
LVSHDKLKFVGHIMDDNQTRDRIRALVREVLDKTLPEESSTAHGSAGTSSRFVDTASKSPVTATEGRATRDESSKSVITEDDVRDLERGAVLRIAEGARLTPLAADMVSEKGIEIVHRVPRRGSKMSKMIAVGSDHGGFKMKEELKGLLTELGHQIHDFGANSEEAVDYPDFAYAVANSVSQGRADVGIMIDGAGVGSAMTANKVPGVRAAACYSVKVAKNSREHNDANVLTLGSGTITNAEMREIVSAWLSTEITEDRHRKRVAKINAIERQYLR